MCKSTAKLLSYCTDTRIRLLPCNLVSRIARVFLADSFCKGEKELREKDNDREVTKVVSECNEIQMVFNHFRPEVWLSYVVCQIQWSNVLWRNLAC